MKLSTNIAISALVLSLTLATGAIAQETQKQNKSLFSLGKLAQAQPTPTQNGKNQQHRPGRGMNQRNMQGRGMTPGGMPGGEMNRQQMPQRGHRPGQGMMPGGMPGRGIMPQAMMQMMGASCPGMGMMSRQNAGPTYISGRIAFLRAELAINEKQNGAFEAYTSALKKNMESMSAMRSNMMAMMQATTPLDRIKAQLSVMETRTRTLKDMRPALENLYNVLDKGQKTKADQILTGMGCMM